MIRRLKKTLSHNKMQKLAALIVSCAMWVFVMSSQDPPMEGSYRVPISLTEFSRDYRVGFKEQSVKVELRGARSNFIEYKATDIHAYLNASNLSEGEYDLPVEITFPRGFELSEVEPATIHVVIDPFIEKQIAAEVIVTGSPVSDSVVRSITKSLENITVIGAKSAVNAVNRVIGYVGLTGNKNDFDLKVPMTAIDEDGREVKGVRVVPAAITVNVDIEKEFNKKVVPITAEISPPAGREIEQITITPNTVEISGRDEILNKTNSIATTKAVITTGNESFDGNLKIILPDGITAPIAEVHAVATLKEN